MRREDNDITLDVLGDADDQLEIAQHRHGYRFGLDTLLMATDLPQLSDNSTVVELGAAHGAASLCVARRHPTVRVVALERQESLFELLVDNIERNDLEGRVEPIRGDVREYRELLEPHAADLVLCNPPYFRRGERRPSQSAQRAAARHELHGELDDFVDAARYVCSQRGRFKVIIPPLRLDDLMRSIDETDLSFEAMRFFHSRADANAYLVEALLRRGGAPDLKVRPPLYIYRNDRDYTDEVERRLERAPRTPDDSSR